MKRIFNYIKIKLFPFSKNIVDWKGCKFNFDNDILEKFSEILDDRFFGVWIKNITSFNYAPCSADKDLNRKLEAEKNLQELVKIWCENNIIFEKNVIIKYVDFVKDFNYRRFYENALSIKVKIGYQQIIKKKLVNKEKEFYLFDANKSYIKSIEVAKNKPMIRILLKGDFCLADCVHNNQDLNVFGARADCYYLNIKIDSIEYFYIQPNYTSKMNDSTILVIKNGNEKIELRGSSDKIYELHYKLNKIFGFSSL